MRPLVCKGIIKLWILQALTGVRYDAVDKTLFIDSKIGDFTSFLSTETGFGTVSFKQGKASVKVVYGKIDINKIEIGKLKPKAKRCAHRASFVSLVLHKI